MGMGISYWQIFYGLTSFFVIVYIAARIASAGWHTGKWEHFKRTWEFTKKDDCNGEG